MNTVGVMGKGVALMFKEAFPGNFEAYEQACKHKDIKLGKMFVTELRNFIGPEMDYEFSYERPLEVSVKDQLMDRAGS